MAKFILMLEVLISFVIIFSSGKKSDDVHTCGISHSKVGCFVDQRRPFPVLLLNKRKDIDWKQWNEFLERFVCECANKTAIAGYKYFGIQFWGECWAGENPDVKYDSDGQSNSCIGRDFLSCDENSSSSCAGAEDENYVYKIVLGQSTQACADMDPAMCIKYRNFCKVYINIAKNCPVTCNLC